jgi:hypothetical protein
MSLDRISTAERPAWLYSHFALNPQSLTSLIVIYIGARYEQSYDTLSPDKISILEIIGSILKLDPSTIDENFGLKLEY